MSGEQLDVGTLHLRHRGYQTRATWDFTTPPVWYARPWGDGSQDRPWDGAITAATAEDLDGELSKLEG